MTRIYQVDAFTRQIFEGNPAGVVLDADHLSDQEMQQIARELNNSETAFYTDGGSHPWDGELRYFTPSMEVPLCGHATIAAMYSLARDREMDSTTLQIKTKVGILPMEIIKKDNDYLISMTQGSYSEEGFPDNEKDSLLQRLGIREDDLNDDCPVVIASTGHSKVLVGLKSRETLQALNPDMQGLSSLSGRIQCNGYFVFVFDDTDNDILTHGRMFAPAIGIHEDPVTGNAHGPLGGYLITNRLVDVQDGHFFFRGMQGLEIGRPGVVDVLVDVNQGTVERVQIRGNAVMVYRLEEI